MIIQSERFGRAPGVRATNYATRHNRISWSWLPHLFGKALIRHSLRFQQFADLQYP
jgi:hypothetical protein